MNNTVADIYLDGTYAQKNVLFGDDNAAWKAKNIAVMLQRTKQDTQTICELGCGGGGILQELQKCLPNTVQFSGYEPMPEAYAVCAQRENERLHFFQQSLNSTNAPCRFDALLMLDVFEHVEDYLGFLREIKGVSRMFYFHIPLDMSVQMVARMTPLKILREHVGHLHYFSKDTALATLQHAGYEIVDWFYTDGSTSNYKTLKYRLLKWPRKILYAFSPDIAVRFLGGYSLLVAAKEK